MYYPTSEHIVEVNKQLVESMKITKAESHKLLRPVSNLDSIIKKIRRVKGSIYNKASILLVDLVRYHVFASGNRRTAFSITRQFIWRNLGEAPMPSINEAESFLMGIREGRYSYRDTEAWLRGA